MFLPVFCTYLFIIETLRLYLYISIQVRVIMSLFMVLPYYKT